MLVYIIISIISLLLVLISYSRLNSTIVVYKGKSESLMKILSFGLVLCFLGIMAFRDTSVGMDTKAYERIYRIICNADNITNAIRSTTLSCPVYIVGCWLVSRVTTNFQWIIFISSVVVNIGLYCFLKKISKNIALSLFVWIGLGVFYFSMNGNRQMMAAVLNLNAFELMLKEKKWFWGGLLLAIAVGIHPTSIIMLLVLVSAYLGRHVTSTKIIFQISLIIGLIVGVFYKYVIVFILRFLPQYMKYTMSMDGRATIFENSGGGRIIFIYIILLIISLFWCFIRDNKDVEIEHDFFAVIVFALTFGIINSKNVYVYRMLLYYLILYCVFFPALVFKMKKSKFIICSGLIIVLFAYSILSLLENQNTIVPYIFNGVGV